MAEEGVVVPGTTGAYDEAMLMFFVKIDFEGSVEWIKVIGEWKDALINVIKVRPGWYLVGGPTESFSASKERLALQDQLNWQCGMAIEIGDAT